LSKSIVYLIPSLLDEDGLAAIPDYVTAAVKDCQVFFVEDERTARRFLKQLWKEMVIDNYEWFTIHKTEQEAITAFRQKLKEGKHIGIISEAGCPGIADPGQQLVAVAQEMDVEVKPLVGPSSILLALMASGMNGQQFRFVGYLPIDSHERTKTIAALEEDSRKNNATQIFIETPYRNNQLLEALVKTCKSSTKLCIAVDLTGKSQSVKTKTVNDWKKNMPDIHKKPAIFLMFA
jgi:16S rRNA (cytidine1402-2'-O)-methyltransferase